MPSLKDIRLRIEATKNTQQITRAMKLVAAAKLRKAQQQILQVRPYAQGLMEIMGKLVHDRKVRHPLIETIEQRNIPNTEKNLLLVIMTSDRGLCGAFNSQVIKFADQFLREEKLRWKKIDLIMIGRKASEIFVRKGYQPIETFLKLDREISYEYARNLAQKMISLYLRGDYQEVRFIYNEFKSAISQKVTSEKIFPVSVPESRFEGDMIFEPDPELILSSLLDKYFSMQVYRCLCESIAAEHGARMSAMENATNNCKELIRKLTLTYNKLRQEKITTELIEIVSGAEAL